MNQYFSCDISQLWFYQDEYADRLWQSINRHYEDRTQKFYFYGRLVWENYGLNPLNAPAFESFIDRLAAEGISITIFVNSVHEPLVYWQKLSHLVDVIAVDYFLWRVYNEVIVKAKSEVSTQWNQHATKFLFLTGKINKMHRVGLLYKFSEAGLLDSAIWSLLLTDDLQDIKNVFIPGLDQIQFMNFLQQHRSHPDEIHAIYQAGDLAHYGGIPYNVDLYRQSLFRVISETNSFDEHTPWITEKTWLAILNCVPFIMAGDRGLLARLESKGFKTFREYQALPDYDSLWIEDRMDAVVVNTRAWISNMTNKDTIQKDVQHNRQRFFELAALNQQKIDAAIKAPGIKRDDVLPTHDPHGENPERHR